MSERMKPGKGPYCKQYNHDFLTELEGDCGNMSSGCEGQRRSTENEEDDFDLGDDLGCEEEEDEDEDEDDECDSDYSEDSAGEILLVLVSIQYVINLLHNVFPIIFGFFYHTVSMRQCPIRHR